MIALGTWLLAGVPAAIPLARRGRRDLALAVVPFAGCLALALPPTLAPLWGISWRTWELQVAVAALALGGLVALLSRAAPLRLEGAASPCREDLLGAAAVVGVALWIAHDGWRFAHTAPAFGWDGLSIWLLRGKVLGLAAEFPAGLFREPDLLPSHWDYPLVFPAFVGWGWRTGVEAPQLPFPLGVLAGSLLVATFLPLRRHLRGTYAAATSLASLAVPGALVEHFGAGADSLLGCAASAGLAWAGAGVVFRDPALLLMASLPLAVAVGTKNEGAALVLGAALACTAVTALDGRLRSDARLLAGAFALPAVVLVAWRGALGALGVATPLLSEARYSALPDRLAVVLSTLAQLLCASAVHVAAGLAVVCAVVFSPRRARVANGRLAAALLVAPALYVAALTFAYCTTPYDLVWHMATSVERTTRVFAPLLFLVAALVSPRTRRPASGVARAP